MTKKELVKIIREVVKREIRNVLNEENVVSKPVLNKNKQKLTKNPLLNEALNATAEFETLANFDSKDAIGGFRQKFASMQEPEAPVQHTDLNGRPVDVEAAGLDKVLNRDYSDLVKRFNK